jgi:AmmeMemoRadiSam system protein B
MVRRAVVAGTFYPGTRERLKEQIRQCFMHSLGPQRIPQVGRKRTIKGAIVPHAGYAYSGHIAAHCYAEIVENGFPDTFIILGPNHTGQGSGVALATRGSWETPLGEVPIDEENAVQLKRGIINEDEKAHQFEHSIEVQLPFLQYFKDFKFIPISMALQDLQTAQEIGEILGSITTDVIVIASTDFSHVGPHYMQTSPPGERVDEWTAEQDHSAIEKILTLDERDFMKTVSEKNISMCGYGCVTALLIAVKKMGATKAQFLKYGTSYDITPGASCVGYGALVFE